MRIIPNFFYQFNRQYTESYKSSVGFDVGIALLALLHCDTNQYVI